MRLMTIMLTCCSTPSGGSLCVDKRSAGAGSYQAAVTDRPEMKVRTPESMGRDQRWSNTQAALALSLFKSILSLSVCVCEV